MKIKLFLLTLFFVVLLEATLTNGLPKKGSSEDDKDKSGESSKEKEKKFNKSNKKLAKTTKCRGHDWKPCKRLVNGVVECQVTKNDAADKREGPVCDALCAWTKAGAIADGKYDKEGLDKLLEELLPGKLKDGVEEVKKKWHKCIKKDFDEKEKDDHPRCMKWYKPFQCLREAFFEHCEAGKDDDDDKESKEDKDKGLVKKPLSFFGLG